MEAARAWQWTPGALADQNLEVTLVNPVVSKAVTPARQGSDRLDAQEPPRADLVARAYVPTARPGPCEI
jgi:hypothetical protein